MREVTSASPVRRAARGGGLLLVLLLFVSASRCNSTAQTTQGPRPAAEVIAQDAVADLLDRVGKVHAASVAAHDARVNSEDPALHASHRESLLQSGAALRASYKLLADWKRSAGSSSEFEVIVGLVPVIPGLLELGVELGVAKAEDVSGIQNLVRTILGGKKP